MDKSLKGFEKYEDTRDFTVFSMRLLQRKFSYVWFFFSFMWQRQTISEQVSLRTHHVYSTFRRRGNGRFQVVSTWNTRGVLKGFNFTFLPL